MTNQEPTHEIVESIPPSIKISKYQNIIDLALQGKIIKLEGTAAVMALRNTIEKRQLPLQVLVRQGDTYIVPKEEENVD